MHQELLKQLNTAYDFVWNNQYSTMYPELYHDKKHAPFTSLSEWETTPFLTKEQLSSFSYRERLFIPEHLITDIRCTSGTSGGKVLIIPRVNHSLDHKLHFDPNNIPKGLLLFFYPRHRYEFELKDSQFDFPIMSVDLTNLEESVRLAKQIGIDTIFGFSFLLLPLYPLLKKYGLADKIRIIEICGETVSDAEFDEIQKSFPNAKIKSIYIAAEFQHVAAYQPGGNFENGVYQPTKKFYMEIITPDGSVLNEEGDEGELVVTTLVVHTSVTPLIRYRTGDRVKIVKGDPDPLKQYYKILGRLELDKIKTLRGFIITELVEESIAHLHPDLTLFFEAHYYARNANEKPSLEISIKQKKDATTSFTPILLGTLAHECAKMLSIGPNTTYADNVEEGLFNPLSIHVVKEFENTTEKRVRLRKHE